MGKITKTSQPTPFTMEEVNTKDIVVHMLLWEQNRMRSDIGQDRYKNPLNLPYVSLTNEHAFHRETLSAFGFDTSDESVGNYRKIFSTYFHSPDDYDHEVINSAYYMKNNRCVYYKAPIIKVGDTIPDVPMWTSNGKTETTLYDIIQKDGGKKITIIAAFSMS
jgi:hypothetical protein